MSQRAELLRLVRHAFNLGMISGMKEFTSSKGGDTWTDSRADLEAKLDAVLNAADLVDEGVGS